MPEFWKRTARTVVEHGDEITQEEKEAIDAVLDYNSLAENYKPHLSDPVKATIRKDADSKVLIRYLVTWFRMFFKYPATYVKATVNQNYLLVYPREENRALYDATLNYEPGIRKQASVKEQEILCSRILYTTCSLYCIHCLPPGFCFIMQAM